MPLPPACRSCAFWDTLTILSFLALLWLPTLDTLFGLDHTPVPQENRLPARWPHFSGLAQSRAYLVAIESYFDDHFGFRKRLIRWNQHWKNQWFQTKASGDAVLVGRDGWLYYAGERMLEHWSRQTAWAEQDLRDWQRLLEWRRDWLRQRGIRYLFVVPPDKHTVYPEYLPDWMEPSAKPSKLQQLAEYLRAHSDLEFVDLSRPLIEAKRTGIDYLKTDSHWNAFGAFIGYRALIQALSRQFLGLEPLPVDAYQWRAVAYPPGDLVALAGNVSCQGAACQETAGVAALSAAAQPDLKPTVDPDPALDRTAGDGTPCFERICRTHNDQANGKALLFRDSFAESWYPLLGLHFRDVIYDWRYRWNWTLIERERPDVVIDEMLERFLNIQNPAELLRQEQLAAVRATP